MSGQVYTSFLVYCCLFRFINRRSPRHGTIKKRGMEFDKTLWHCLVVDIINISLVFFVWTGLHRKYQSFPRHITFQNIHRLVRILHIFPKRGAFIFAARSDVKTNDIWWIIIGTTVAVDFFFSRRWMCLFWTLRRIHSFVAVYLGFDNRGPLWLIAKSTDLPTRKEKGKTWYG